LTEDQPAARSGLRVMAAPDPQDPVLPAPRPGSSWTDADADRWLGERDLVGWRFELDRIRKLLAALGDPQKSAPAIHVVGTNGKSSTTRMIAALLSAHGHNVGAYLSPHLHNLRERVELSGTPLTEPQHAAAVAAVARACEQVDQPGDPVTQFEAHTASAFVAFSSARCDVTVVEAGLGGRLDSTNVLDAPVVALTSVGLEHTALLGDTVEQITAEKVAVVTPGSTLVLGAGLPEAAEFVARTHAADVGASVITATTAFSDRHAGAPYQQANFALARAATEAYLGQLDPRRVLEVVDHFSMPARFERIAERPLTILDGAHNPDGVRALVAGLRDLDHPGPVVAVISVLSDKDLESMVRELATVADQIVACDCGTPRAIAPELLAQRVKATLPGYPVHTERGPVEALRRAQRLVGEDGLVVACGTLGLARTLSVAGGDR
jgi:dihydrofolate synthase/folylpolyglutamate synthase